MPRCNLSFCFTVVVSIMAMPTELKFNIATGFSMLNLIWAIHSTLCFVPLIVSCFHESNIPLLLKRARCDFCTVASPLMNRRLWTLIIINSAYFIGLSLLFTALNMEMLITHGNTIWEYQYGFIKQRCFFIFVYVLCQILIMLDLIDHVFRWYIACYLGIGIPMVWFFGYITSFQYNGYMLFVTLNEIALFLIMCFPITMINYMVGIHFKGLIFFWYKMEHKEYHHQSN